MRRLRTRKGGGEDADRSRSAALCPPSLSSQTHGQGISEEVLVEDGETDQLLLKVQISVGVPGNTARRCLTL